MVAFALTASCDPPDADDPVDVEAPDIAELDSDAGSGPPADRTPCQRSERWDGPACVDGDVVLTCDCREAAEGGYFWLCLSVGRYTCNTDEACARIFPGERPYCESRLDDSWDCACARTSTPSQYCRDSPWGDRRCTCAESW